MRTTERSDEEGTTEDFLAVVGNRVRERRSSVHMSRRRLAECSGVSERYLALLEGGQGNMSIVLLRKVAAALDMPLPELVAERDAAPPLAPSIPASIASPRPAALARPLRSS